MSHTAQSALQPNTEKPNKAPSAGVKVTTNAPTRQEGTGAVNSDSLAAESQAFREANSIESDKQQNRPEESASFSAHAPGTSTSYSQGGSMARETGGKTANTAPSYVNNQYHRDPNGPHGKNIKEDDSLGTGKNASYAAEIGSKDDPSLLAEQTFTNRNATAPGAQGGRQGMNSDKSTFDGLENEREV